MKSFMLFLSLIFSISVPLYAQNFNDALRISDPGLGSNARALGMGNAYDALSDDYSAVFFNPAGLGLMRSMEFAGSINYNSFSNTTNFFNSSTSESNSSTDLGQVGFVFPLPTMRGSMVFAAGFSRSKSFNSVMSFNGFNGGSTSKIEHLVGFNDPLTWELYLSEGSSTNQSTIINGKLNQSGTVEQEGSINKWSFAGAVEAAKDVFVGATINFIGGSFISDNKYYEDDTRNNYGSNLQIVQDVAATSDFQTFHMNDIIDWELSGYELKLGLMYKMQDIARYGFTVKFPSYYSIDEKYIVDGYSEFADARFEFDPPVEEEYSYEIATPFEFSGGASVSLNPVILTGNLTFIDYTQMEFTEGLTDVIERTSLNDEIETLMRGVLNYNLGAEVNLPVVNTRVRAGFIYKPSPFEGDPSEFNKKYLTFGLGVLPQSKLSFDLAYAYGWWESVGDNYGNPGDSRTYQDITRHNFVMTVLYRY
ncbi:MAG: transporter [Melioribacteraceae bacterium]|nr:MAG: transporter [Melioribacteraceae bacterium]